MNKGSKTKVILYYSTSLTPEAAELICGDENPAGGSWARVVTEITAPSRRVAYERIGVVLNGGRVYSHAHTRICQT